MPDYFHMATPQQATAAHTQELLQSNFHAIWCPPDGRIPWNVTVYPTGGEKLWLLYRQQNGEILLLGGGRIQAAPRQLFNSTILFTNPDAPGVRGYAENLGYRGGNAMAFFALEPVLFPDDDPERPERPPVPGFQAPSNGMNQANAIQAAQLENILAIP